jgi:hypothetical protein
MAGAADYEQVHIEICRECKDVPYSMPGDHMGL